MRIEAELGVGGLLPVAIFIAAIFRALDIIIIYCFMYYGMSFLVATLTIPRSAISRSVFLYF